MAAEPLPGQTRRDRRPSIQLNIVGLFPLQRRLVEETATDVWCASGTKGGKTRAAAVWLVMKACELGAGDYWWVGPWYRSVKHGFRELRRVCRALEKAGLAKITPGELRIELANGAIIECRSGENPDTLYGPGVKAAVVDEATRCRPGVYDAMKSVTTQTNGPIRWLFNVDRGRRHWAIRKLTQVEDEAKDSGEIAPDGLSGRTKDGKAAFFHFKTSANPYISPEVIEERRKNLPERSFAALYLAEIQEDGAGVFAERDVDASQILRYVLAEDGHPRFDPNGRYVVGVDLARKQDYTVAIVIDTRTMQVADWMRFNQAEWTKQVESVAWLAKRWRAGAVVEANGVGDPIIELIQKQGVSVSPFLTTNQSKADLISGLMLAFEQRRIYIPEEDVFEQLGRELLSFEYSYTKRGNLQYSAPPGFHDDCVMSLALAVWGAKNLPGPFLFAPVGRHDREPDDDMTMDDQWRKGM